MHEVFKGLRGDISVTSSIPPWPMQIKFRAEEGLDISGGKLRLGHGQRRAVNQDLASRGSIYRMSSDIDTTGCREWEFRGYFLTRVYSSKLNLDGSASARCTDEALARELLGLSHHGQRVEQAEGAEVVE